jgi:hypothetical protein
LYGKLYFGYAYVQIKPIKSCDAKELAKKCVLRSESITEEQAQLILQLIRNDATDTSLEYNNLGGSELYAFAHGEKKYGNCLTFAEKWLKDAGIKFIDESEWEKSLLPFDISSHRPYFMSPHYDGEGKEKQNEKKSKGCLIQ